METIIANFNSGANAVNLIEDSQGYRVETTSEMVSVYESFESSEYVQAMACFKETKKKIQIVEIINKFTTEMEGYAYFGSNPGVPVDMYEEVAQELLKNFFVK